MTRPRPDPRDVGGPSLRVGVDIGGSKVAVLVVDAADASLARRSVPAASAEPDEAIAQITSVIRDAVDEAGATMADVAAIGLGVPGRVDRATGDVTFAVNLGWQHLPLGQRLEAALGVPCVVENDVRAAAVGLHQRAPLRPDRRPDLPRHRDRDLGRRHPRRPSPSRRPRPRRRDRPRRPRSRRRAVRLRPDRLLRDDRRRCRHRPGSEDRDRGR